MKNFIVTSFVLLGLISPTLADFLSDQLIEATGPLGARKDIASPKTRTGRSNLYGTQYPKVGPLVHSYNHAPFLAPFSGEIPENRVQVPHSLTSHVHAIRHRKSFAFIVQGIENAPNSPANPGNPYCLKPQYWLFPDAPQHSPLTQAATVRWTVVPGSEGQVRPAGARSPAILQQTGVSIHPAGGNLGNLQILSGDSMHLSGIAHPTSVDFYDFVAEDRTQTAAITYRWMLNNADLNLFNQILQGAGTFQALITGIEGRLPSFSNRLNELKRFIGLLPRPPAPQPVVAAQPPVVRPAPQPVAVAQPPVVRPAPQPVAVAHRSRAVGPRAMSRSVRAVGPRVMSSRSVRATRSRAVHSNSRIMSRSRAVRGNSRIMNRSRAVRGNSRIMNRSRAVRSNSRIMNRSRAWRGA